MLRPLPRFCVRYAERYIPNPFLYAVILTFITVSAALLWTASNAGEVIDAWYKGIWEILAFALQMALVLVTGVTLADTPVVKNLLRKLGAVPAEQTGAAITVFFAGAIGAWLNWGFGLVVGALVAREIAKRLKDVDFSFLVAAAYMGFMVWASGLSSSIALATATHGSAINFVERITGHIAGFDQTILSQANLVPVLLLMVAMPTALALMAPTAKDMKCVDPGTLARQDRADEADWNEYSGETLTRRDWKGHGPSQLWWFW